MKVKKLKINRFRHLHDLELEFGNRLTAIAGQNGTGKSCILGLVGHAFTFSTKYKTLDNKQFATQYSEIFRFSYPKFDKPKDHDYSIELDNGKKVNVLSYDRLEKGKKPTLRLRVGKSERGRGKKKLPVIYLGLRRLFPLAQERTLNQDPNKVLKEEETKKYKNLHNEILILDDEVKTEYVRGFSKRFYATRTDEYDSLGNSAGQDNIGQVLTAMFSFERLKKELGSDYNGGILLIDEVDAVLYPAAQVKLIEKLFRIASDLDLQIIFTTHSTDTLRKITDPCYRNDAKVIFLSNDLGEIKNVQDEVTVVEMINNLRVTAPLPKKIEKIPVYCEDNESKFWIRNLLGRDVTKKLLISSDKFGGSELVNLANKKAPSFKKSIFVLDGDQEKSLKRNRCPRIILLPEDDRPENIFYNFLKKLPPNYKFWEKTGGYTKQVCFRDRPNLHTDRTIMKKWFNNQQPFWGVSYSKIFNRWKEDNQKVAEKFKDDFLNIINKI